MGQNQAQETVDGLQLSFFLVQVIGFVVYAFAHNIVFFYLAAIILLLLVLR